MALTKAILEPDNSNLDHFPGEYGIPFFGKMIQIVDDSIKVCDDHFKRFGPVSKIDMVKNQKVLLCLGPEFNEATLFDKDDSFSSAAGYHNSLGTLYPEGMLLRDGGMHKKTRRASQPSFKTDALKSYVELLLPIQEKRIAELPVNKEFLFYDAIQQTLMDVAARVFLGLDETSRMAKKLNNIFTTINKGLITPLPYNIPFSTFCRALKARERLRAYIHTNIPKRRGSDGVDMFTRYCNAQDEEGAFLDDIDIDGHIAFLMFAAFDTTTSALTNILYYLGTHPEWQDKVRAEITQIGKKDLTYEDASSMVLTEYVFNETLRFYPSVMILNRRATKDVEIAGYHIPKNTVLMLSPAYTHRMPEWWSDPETFDPMRFSPERAEHKRHGFSYIPFGGGAHKCIGMHFAQLNAKLYLFRLLRKYRVKLRDNYNPKFMHVHLPRPKDKLPITLEPI